jgi:hypothetical protein
MRQTVLLLVLSCARAPVKSAAPDWQLLSATPGTKEITFLGEIRLRRAAITQTGAVGPDLDLKRSATAIEGTTRSQPVSLHTREDGMEGNVNGNDFGVSLSQDGAATRVTGIVGAQPSTFRLSRSTLRGTIGQCLSNGLVGQNVRWDSELRRTAGADRPGVSGRLANLDERPGGGPHWHLPHRGSAAGRGGTVGNIQPQKRAARSAPIRNSFQAAGGSRSSASPSTKRQFGRRAKTSGGTRSLLERLPPPTITSSSPCTRPST